MESFIALVISAVGLAGAFYMGVGYGKDMAYEEALKETARVYEEVYKEDETRRGSWLSGSH